MDKLYFQAKKWLSEEEASKLIAFNQDKVMKDAVKKVILMELYCNGTLNEDAVANPLRNFTLSLGMAGESISDEQIGKDLRRRWEGINCCQTGFDIIARFVEDPIPSPYVDNNPAV